MKRIIASLIFSFFLLNIYAQDSYVKLPVSGSNCPTVIIEKYIIANECYRNSKKIDCRNKLFERQTKSERA